MIKETQQDPLLQIDSYGCIFMYATHKDLTTAPRHIIRMSEQVDPRVLLAALRMAYERYPQFALGLVRGEKQYAYRRLTKPPVVLPMEDISPYYIGSDDTNGYLVLSGYKENTIYLEYQHCTSDGRGFDQFIRTVLYYYLRQLGHDDVENNGSIRTLKTKFTPRDCQDGYRLLKWMPQSDANHHPDVPAFHMPEYDSSNDDNELTTELSLPLAKVLAYTKSNGITPLTFLMTAISKGMYRTYYIGTDRQEAIVAEVPMDLRAYVRTPTTRFFVSLLDLPFFFQYFSMSFLDACKACKAYFDTQRSLPHSVYWALKNATRVSTAHKRDMPIDEKEQMMRQQARNYIRRDSFILTNIGEFKLPPSMEPYVLDYAAILPCAFQPFGILVSTYKNTLKISISQRDFNYHLVENIRAELKDIGIESSASPYTFHVTRYDGLHLAKDL